MRRLNLRHRDVQWLGQSMGRKIIRERYWSPMMPQTGFDLLAKPARPIG